MELPKLIILLCCTYFCLGSEHTNTIPVEHYETELTDLGEHVDIPEPPVRVVKITKTIAVKIPVPYPVKVIEKVPYPVHVNKPYPVPVPQIVHIPHPSGPKPLVPTTHEGQQNHGGHEDSGHPQQFHQDNFDNGQSYGVHEDDHSSENNFGGGYEAPTSHGGYQAPASHSSYEAPASHSSYEAPGSHSSYEAPVSGGGFYGNADDHSGHESFEAKSYDLALKQYLQKHSSGSGLHH